jgi:hypothetical protein
MDKLNIALIRLGHQKESLDRQYVESWPSKLFRVAFRATIDFPPDAQGDGWEYPDSQLRDLVRPIDSADITVIVVGAPLERNFYSRRLGNNVVAITLHEMAPIVSAANYRLEHFLIRSLYQLTVYFRALGSIPASDDMSWSHLDIRGCLFDMNVYKTDILYSMHIPKLCDACRTRTRERQVDADFLPALDRELSKLRRGLFYRAADWVKLHPLLSLGITAAFGITLNIMASVIFEKISRAWPWLR